MKQNKKDVSKALELRSEEVQEVMNRIPSTIIRCGMTVMAVIVISILFAMAHIRWPKIVECPFEWTPNINESEITATIPPEAIKHLSNENSRHVTLNSKMFPAEYAEIGISAIITDYAVENKQDGSAVVHLNLEFNDSTDIRTCNHKIVGNMMMVMFDKTLLQCMAEKMIVFGKIEHHSTRKTP